MNLSIFLYLVFGVFHFVFPPYIPPFDHAHRCPGTGINDYAFYGFIADQGIVDDPLERNVLISPESAIAGDDVFGLGVVEAVGDALCAEAPEDHRVNGADTGATEHCIGQFGNHTHIYTNTVSFLYTIVYEHLRYLANPLVQPVIGNDAYPLFRVVRLPDNGGFIAHRCQVPVDAVLGDVQFCSFEPFYPGLLEIPFQDLVPFPAPGKMSGNIAPERLRVFNALLIICMILIKRRDLKRIRHNNRFSTA